MTPLGAATKRLVALIVLTGVALLGLLAWRGQRLRTDGDRLVLDALARLPPDATCGRRLGEWAALARGVVAPEAEPCFEELARTAYARRLLLRVAREPARDDRSRLGALDAILRGGDRSDELILDLLLSPRTRPSVRHAALDLLAARPDGGRWADLAADVPMHGLAERGTLHLAAADEPGRDVDIARAAQASRAYAPRRAERALGAMLGLDPALLRSPRQWTHLEVGEASVLEQWPCERDCVEPLLRLVDRRRLAAGIDDREDAPPWDGPDALLDTLAGEGDAADITRERGAVLVQWVRMGGDAEAAYRLRAALAHPDAGGDGETFVAGSPAAVLDGAVGSPGVQGVLLRAVGAAAGVEVELRRDTRAGGEGGEGRILARLPGHGSAFMLGGCAEDGDPEAIWAEARPLRPGELEAAAVEEAMGFALRAGDAAALPPLTSAARQFPAESAAARAVVIASAALGVPVVRPDALPREGDGGPRLLTAPWITPPPARTARKGRRATPAPPSPADRAPPSPADRATVERAWAERAAGVGPDATLAAAWWAHAQGHADLARALLAAMPAPPGSMEGARLRGTLAALLDEPAGDPTTGATTDVSTALGPPGTCGGLPTTWPAGAAIE